MEKLIKKLFSIFLRQEVRMINLPDDNVDMAIYVSHDKKTKKLSDKELSEYAPDFAITRNGSDNIWVYLITIHHDAVIRNNELVSPPESDMVESVMTYKTAENALEALLIAITKDKIQNIIMEWSYEKSME